VVRTRVGYTGGTTRNPTYSHLGDHTETVQIDYDPTRITYKDLLDIFWKNHDPTARSWTCQYMPVIFYHSNAQKKLAEQSKQRLESEGKRRVYTEILPAKEFYLAEDYHQKYYLRQIPELMNDFKSIYPDEKDFIASTAVARANGYVGGYGKIADLQLEIKKLGLSPEGEKKLRMILSSSQRQ